MELYLVKDIVQLINLEEEHKKTPSRFYKPSPYLNVDLNFPSKVKPVVDSKSNREFVGKLRDVIKRDYKMASAEFWFRVDVKHKYNSDSLTANVIFSVSRDEYRENREFDTIFGKNNCKIRIRLSLCHLPTRNSPVPPADHLYTFTENVTSFGQSDSYTYYTDRKEEVGKVVELWDHETGYIYAKFTIGVTLNKKGVTAIIRKGNSVDNFNEIGAMTRKLLEEEICTDLEIRCGDGGIVKGHRAVLAGRSKVFQAMFQAEEMKEAKMGQLEMEEMSEQGVRAFLRWIYWKDEKEAVEESDVAVEMLIAADKYDLEVLVKQVKEIILERRGYDERWFGVESAGKLFRWASSLDGLNEFKERAIHVLKFFEKTCPEKLEESEDYKELFKNEGDANISMESSEDDDDEFKDPRLKQRRMI